MIKNNKVSGADCYVNTFLKHGGSDVRSKLLKIMNDFLKRGNT